jgi:hypothetical protein
MLYAYRQMKGVSHHSTGRAVGGRMRGVCSSLQRVPADMYEESIDRNARPEGDAGGRKRTEASRLCFPPGLGTLGEPCWPAGQTALRWSDEHRQLSPLAGSMGRRA